MHSSAAGTWAGVDGLETQPEFAPFGSTHRPSQVGDHLKPGTRLETDGPTNMSGPNAVDPLDASCALYEEHIEVTGDSDPEAVAT